MGTNDSYIREGGLSRGTLLLLMAGLVVAGLGAGGALLLYLQNRPVDLLDKTRAVAQSVQEDLVESGVPERYITRTEEETRKDISARWYACVYEVKLPATHDPTIIRQNLVAKLAKRDVGLLPDSQDTDLRFTFAGCEFARVRMEVSESTAVAQTPEPEPEPAHHPVESHSEPAAATPTTPAPEPAPMAPVSESPTHEGEAPTPVIEPETHAPEPVVPAEGAARPRIAIIVDDGGYGGGTTDAILALDPKLTLAILPHTPHGTSTARRAAERGFEVMLHMPMLAEEATGDALKPLTLDMTPDSIYRHVETALAQVPGAVGVNNHEGSKFTGDTAAMTAFLTVLKGRSLYFVDSMTSPLSVGAETAQAMGIPCAVRDVFLDNERDSDYIRRQFDELCARARRQGSAVGICHFRADTAAVLGELLAHLKNEGEIDLVHASELVK